MLKQRICTAAILIPCVILAIFFLPTVVLAAIFGAIVLLGAWEWAKLFKWDSPGLRLSFVAITFLVLFAEFYISRSALGLQAVLWTAPVWWLIAGGWIYRYNQSKVTAANQLLPLSQRLKGLLIGLLVLTPPWLTLVTLHGSDIYGPRYVLFLLLLIWLADTAAYVFGRSFGRRKLAPQVSPGKTWEGVFGALLSTGIFAVSGASLLNVPDDSRLIFVFICLVSVIFSIIGDLFESMIKRRAGVKDSGELLPGHGGVLDRIDSVTAAAPLFLFGIIGFGVGH